MSEKIKNIIEVFETGKLSKNYGAVAILGDGAGISYGRFQATDKSGNLDAILNRYIQKGGLYSNKLGPYLINLASNKSINSKERWVSDLIKILIKAGENDAIMAQAQDEIFDENYFIPSKIISASLGLEKKLSQAVVFDTCIQSGPNGIWTIRKLFKELPPSKGGDEMQWTTAYVRARRDWLMSFTNDVRKTTYRMDVFQKLINDKNWDLEMPFRVLGVEIQ